jgi:hypothetical protein
MAETYPFFLKSRIQNDTLLASNDQLMTKPESRMLFHPSPSSFLSHSSLETFLNWSFDFSPQGLWASHLGLQTAPFLLLIGFDRMKPIPFLTVVLLLVCPACVFARLEAVHVTLDYVAKEAEVRAQKPFHSPRADLPPFLSQLTYDQYGQIAFRDDRALWGKDNLPFRVEFFHLGYLYQEPVHFNEFTATHAQPVRFVSDFFDYRSLHLPARIPPTPVTPVFGS